VTRIYADYNATAPLRPVARDAFVDAMGAFGNPSSSHREGRKARRLVEDARGEVAAVLGVPNASIVFASGATECLLLASETAKRSGARRALVSAVEHDAAKGAAKAAFGDEVIEIGVDRNGRLNLDVLVSELADGDLAVVQAVNSETGIIQDIEGLGQRVKAAGATLLVDAAQAVGRLPVEHWLSPHMTVMAGHKFGAGMGAGTLVSRDAQHLKPTNLGGRQENGFRSGTENVGAIAAFAAALKAAEADRDEMCARLSALRAALEARIARAFPDAVLIGNDIERVANTTCVAIPGWSSEAIVLAMDLEGAAISAGSACSSGKVQRRPVLDAMGFAPDISGAAVRLSFGWESTAADYDIVFEALCRAARRAGIIPAYATAEGVT
jgi:cysteine desulfurase